MTPFDFFDAVQRAQQEFDIDRLTLGGVNHWMIVRLLMLGSLAQEARRRAVEVAGLSAHSRAIDNPLHPPDRKAFPPTAYTRRVLDNATMLFEPPASNFASAEMVFYELPVDYTLVTDGQAVNRIADGFVEAFGERVRKVCRFSPEMIEKACRIEPSYVFLAPSALDVPAEERARFAQAVRDLCVYLQRQAPDFALFPQPILDNVSLVLTQAGAHQAWLRAIAPKIVAFQCFISMEKMSVLVACMRLGIPTMEVQHGFCDANSIFNEMPPPIAGNKSLFTDLFWSWGEQTAAALSVDSGFVSNRVDVVVGGDVWGALSVAKGKAGRGPFLDRIGAHKYSKRVLVGHQIEALVHSSERRSLVPEFILNAMRQAPADWLWMVRVHPRSSHLIEPIKTTLASAGIANSEVEATSFEAIETVLEAADIYLTGFSVSALEANAIGKPVILLDQVGRRLFRELVDTGVFGFADTADELCKLIGESAPSAHDFGYYRRDLDFSRRTFDGLLRPQQMDIAS